MNLAKLISKGAENLLRNWLTSIPTIIVIAIVLTMFHGLLVVYGRAQNTLKTAAQKFSITVYLKDDADPFEVGAIITALEERSDVVPPVTYTSKEAAWELMNKAFSLDMELLKKYKFSLPASLTITPRSPENAQQIEGFLNIEAKHILKDPSATKDKQKNITNQMIEFIQNIKDTLLKAIVLFIVLFVLGGSLLMWSTIHLAINSRHIEMNIMKLVGASYSKITAPFVMEGLLLSLSAFILHLLLVIFLPLGYLENTLYLNALLLECLAVMLLGGIVSYLTTLFHIKKKTFI